jgi:hypothetical protein
MIKSPRLIIGGAPKSGTTALYYYLIQHPGFCLSQKKELHFFSRPSLDHRVAGPGDRYILAEIPRNFDEYLTYFDHCGAGQVAVDISPSYLSHAETADNIFGRLPQARILFILRNPADKAYSQYLHLVGAGREELSFEKALAIEEQRHRNGYADIWLYRQGSFYAQILEHYIQVFGRESVKIFYYEELQSAPDRVLDEICGFVGAEQGFRFEPVTDVNRSGAPRSPLVAKVFLAPSSFTYLLRRVVPASLGRSVRRFIKERNTGAKPALAQELRLSLLADYRDDILRVEALVGRPSGWI